MYRQYTKRHKNRIIRQRKLEILGVHVKRSSSNSSAHSLLNEPHNSDDISSDTGFDNVPTCSGIIVLIIIDKNLRKKEISYNVHNLIHLTNNFKRFGIVDSFSAFSFENYMQRIKKLIRKSEKPVQQISNRINEFDYKKNLTLTEPYPKMM